MLKDELEAIIASDNAWSGRATLLLAIGILGEYVAAPFFEHANITLMMAVFRSRRATGLRNTVKRCGAVLKTLFAAMVLAGVVGEYGFSSRIAINANRLQRIADQELADATDRATQAIELGGVIGDRADRLARLLKTEQETTARFQSQAMAAELALAKELDRVDKNAKRNGPRGALLRAAKIGSDPRLRPFIGQLLYIMDCQGEPGAFADEETADASFTIARELFFEAKWNARLDHRDCNPQPTSWGLSMLVSPRANATTIGAAKTLVAVLRDALLIEPNDELSLHPLETAELPRLTPESGATDPNTVMVRVDTHPLR